MGVQTVFKRHELKYILTSTQKAQVLKAMSPYMRIDKYDKVTIRNIYFDTDDYRLIRRSIEKPAYKEKLRIRTYQQATADSEVFVELKKKYDKVVYKRRLILAEDQAMAWVSKKIPCPINTQISREIDYFIKFYEKLKPAVFLCYDREAYFEIAGGSFRITFDNNILSRSTDLSLCSPAYGERVLDEALCVMELKCSGGIPIWLTKTLSCERIYKTSFSKYGTAYQKLIFPTLYTSKNTKTKDTYYGCNI